MLRFQYFLVEKVVVERVCKGKCVYWRFPIRKSQMELSALDHFGPIKKQFHVSQPSALPCCAEFSKGIPQGNPGPSFCLLRILKPKWTKADVSNKWKPF